jgi:hypothetical protein
VRSTSLSRPGNLTVKVTTNACLHDFEVSVRSVRSQAGSSPVWSKADRRSGTMHTVTVRIPGTANLDRWTVGPASLSPKPTTC